MFGFRKGKLRPSWRYNTNHAIWRVLPTGAGKLVCEIRDLDQKRTHFVSINQTTGAVEWESGFGDDWWIGVETVQRGVLLLHKYASPDLPEHRSITAVSIHDGKVIWHNDELRFEGVGGGRAYASIHDRMSMRFVEVDIETGNVHKEFDSYDAMRKDSGGSHDEPKAEVLFPACKPDINGFESAVQHFCSKQKVVGPIEYIENGSYFICSLHERSARSSKEQSMFDTTLHVLKNRKLVFSEKLNRDSSTFMQGSFLVEDGTLLFTKDRSTLTAVSLRTPNDESIR